MSLRALLSLALLTAYTSLHAEDKILFIGNSFTYGDGGVASVPEIFDRLAIAGGHTDPTTAMRAVGGQNFQFHLNDATSQAAIASQQWTYVVLQNYSTEPTHIGSVANHLNYGNQLYNRVLANNPATKVILYETWSRAAIHPLISGTSTAITFASTDEMQSELRTNYQALADALNTSHPTSAPVAIAPVGDAWQNVGGFLPTSDPSFNRVHGGDNYHGNDNGYFLSAAVFYSRIYGQSPEGLHTHPAVSSLNLQLTVDPVLLEQTAWKTVNGTLEVRYVGQPASQSVTENQPVTFTAKALGSLPFTVQWFRNGEPIQGATSLSYTIPSASTTQSGGAYTVNVSNGVSSLLSNAATLTVTTDTAAPLAGQTTLVDSTTVTLAFNEALASGPAATASNFTVIYHGQRINVLSATLPSNGSTVTLKLASPIQKGFTVAVSQAIKDLAGNPVASGTASVSTSDAPVGKKFLIDFGANETPTNPVDDPINTWNNVNTTIGTSNTGVIPALVDTTGVTSTARLEMVRRFNAANGNGTTASALYPASATRDSLYGNTESFNSLTNIFPAFRLSGLDTQSSYSLTFHASRLGVSDNRETVYTVTGAAVNKATLNIANNVDNTISLTGLVPAANGTLLIELAPSTLNNNANHFTYLGVLGVTSTSTAPAAFYPPVSAEGSIILDWTGTGRLEASPDLKDPWTPINPAPAPPYTESVTAPARFYHLVSGTP